jgi:hypothetical protein
MPTIVGVVMVVSSHRRKMGVLAAPVDVSSGSAAPEPDWVRCPVVTSDSRVWSVNR